MKTFDGLKKGTRLLVIGNHNGHSYEIGHTYTLKVDGRSSSMSDPFMEVRGNTIEARDCKMVSVTLESLQNNKAAKIEAFNSEMEVLDYQIQYCIDNGLKEFDPEVVNLQAIISALSSSSLSDAKKAEKIIRFLKQ